MLDLQPIKDSLGHQLMGIGAYESAQYIKELGGEMKVESQENSGTRVTMILPLFDLRTESDLRQGESL